MISHHRHYPVFAQKSYAQYVQAEQKQARRLLTRLFKKGRMQQALKTPRVVAINAERTPPNAIVLWLEE